MDRGGFETGPDQQHFSLQNRPEKIKELKMRALVATLCRRRVQEPFSRFFYGSLSTDNGDGFQSSRVKIFDRHLKRKQVKSFFFFSESSVWLPRQFGKNKRKLNLEFPLFIWILFYIVLGYRKNIIGEKAAPHQRTMGLRFCYCRPFGCWENVGKRSELKHGDLLFFLLVFS